MLEFKVFYVVKKNPHSYFTGRSTKPSGGDFKLHRELLFKLENVFGVLYFLKMQL